MKKRLLMIFLVFMIYIIAVSASQYIMPWYAVEDWEIEACSKWGGTTQAATISSGTVGSSFLDQTTVTLQAQATAMNDSYGQVTYTYEVAWYFQPVQNQQAYKVQLLGPDKTKDIYKGSATVSNGDSNYYAEETTTRYDKAKIIYETGTLLVPVVEK